MAATITPQDTFKATHEEYMSLVCPASTVTVVAALLLIPGLIVLISASLCLTLPGVNVLNQVIVPGVLPGGGAVLLSIPFWVAAALYGRKKTAKWSEVSNALRMWMGDPNVFVAKSKEERKTFIDKVVVACGDADKFNKNKVLDLIKEHFPKEKDQQTAHHKDLIKQIEKKKSIQLAEY